MRTLLSLLLGLLLAVVIAAPAVSAADKRVQPWDETRYAVASRVVAEAAIRGFESEFAGEVTRNFKSRVTKAIEAEVRRMALQDVNVLLTPMNQLRGPEQWGVVHDFARRVTELMMYQSIEGIAADELHYSSRRRSPIGVRTVTQLPDPY